MAANVIAVARRPNFHSEKSATSAIIDHNSGIVGPIANCIRTCRVNSPTTESRGNKANAAIKAAEAKGYKLPRKKIFLFAIVVFLVGSALAGWAGSMEQLIMFRALQGIGDLFAQHARLGAALLERASAPSRPEHVALGEQRAGVASSEREECGLPQCRGVHARRLG